VATDLNAQMVERLKTSRAIRSSSVEQTFRTVLRHQFLPGVALDLVYSGNAIVTRSDPVRGITSSSSEVAIMAPMLEALRLEGGERVLEIGAGTGYNAALLDELVGPEGDVTSIDNQESVIDDARAHLVAAGRTRVRVVVGDGYAGWADAAPYDRIMATASVRDIPLAWRDQLREGGLLVVPLRFGPGAQIVATFRRQGERLASVGVVAGGFMPLRTDCELLEEPLKVATDLDVAIASPRDGDSELMSELLVRAPTLEVFDSYPALPLFSLAGLIEPDWIVVRPRGRNGMWQGLVDRASSGIVLIWPVPLPTGASQANLLVYGSRVAADRLRSLLAELATVAVDRVRVDALPKTVPAAADVVYRQPHFTYAISWRAARAEPPGTTAAS
jgi:protein-L-isoaspartate(D-aspartate) O-methyltransferase